MCDAKSLRGEAHSCILHWGWCFREDKLHQPARSGNWCSPKFFIELWYVKCWKKLTCWEREKPNCVVAAMRNCSSSQCSQWNGRCVPIHSQPQFASCLLHQPFQLLSGLFQKKACFVVINIYKAVMRCYWFVTSVELLWCVPVLPWYLVQMVVGWLLEDFEMPRIFRRLEKEFCGWNLTSVAFSPTYTDSIFGCISELSWWIFSV